MKSHPLLFSAPMVRAIRDGRKTETRRIFNGDEWDAAFDAPKYHLGDEIWIKETYALIDMEDDGVPRVEYRADTNGKCRPGGWPDAGPDEFQSDPSIPKWKPSIFMPRKLSRITLRVTGERIERLQEITEEGAVAEGCQITDRSPRREYESLWDSINPEMPWRLNPWVRVIQFEKA